ncbi:MAG TPA: hypothetical protein VN224_06190 [Xanthomonadales bacterium]|nr:hypothetical protein [Xanthomonadales bacterium]
MTASPSTAVHLADIDARYDAHLAALRQHAAQLQATVARGAPELADRAVPQADPEPPS